MTTLKKIVFIIFAVFLVGACSSDPDSPLGNEFIDDGTLGGRPGTVFQDTIRVTSGDQSFFVGSRLDKNPTLSLGLKSGYLSSMVVKFDFSGVGPDTLRIVDRASLRLKDPNFLPGDSLIARFYELLEEYNEGDTLQALQIDPTPIPDEGLTNVDREMPTGTANYLLPTALVQDWIRGDRPHNGIAVVVRDTISGKQFSFGSRENSEKDDRPLLAVNFTDGAETKFSPTDDGTFVESTTSTTNLVISDGFIRRILVPVDLSGFDPDNFIHDAKLVLNADTTTDLGIDFSVLLYAPDSDDPADPSVRSGPGVSTGFVNFVSNQLVLPLTDRRRNINILQLFVGGERENNGLALRFYSEGQAVRQVEFYTSASDTLGPRIIITASEAPIFKK
ncbi:MAG: hypothetical protein GTN72_16335 [Candidatus Latescibacteria bacterium]|nr:hypothetical protein [Candidatus Latescibacterota bacterium]